MLRSFIRSLIAVAFLAATAARAGTIDSVGTYHGMVNGVAVDFFAGIGVGLSGVTCNGQSVVILPYSNAKWKEIYALLLAAETAGKSVRFYRTLDTISTFGGGAYAYCTISAAALGDFPLW